MRELTMEEMEFVSGGADIQEAPADPEIVVTATRIHGGEPLIFVVGGTASSTGSGGSRLSGFYMDGDGRLWVSQNDCLKDAADEFLVESIKVGAELLGGIGSISGPWGALALSGIGAYLGFNVGLAGMSTYAAAQCPP